MGELCHVGACFEGLDALVLTAPSVLHCLFFTILTLLLERCVMEISCDAVIVSLLFEFSFMLQIVYHYIMSMRDNKRDDRGIEPSFFKENFESFYF